MNRDSVILTIKSMSDLENLSNSSIKYINIDIKNVDRAVIDYLKKNGNSFLYSESIDGVNGYIYVSYDTFFEAEEKISCILNDIPSDLSEVEKAKYLYIAIGRNIGYDINTIPEKNEVFNFANINTINNIWGAVSNMKATNQSYCKLYLYLCSLLNIKCELISVNNRGFLCNKLLIDNKSLIVNLTEDVPYIEAKFKTRHFSNYNDNVELDKKIRYIDESYSEIELDKLLVNINQNDDDFVFKFLVETQKVVDINNINPIELGIIFDMLFSKYCSDVNIHINNLYINDVYNNRKHFILISYNDKYYCYNYNKGSFVNISEKDLVENIENERIGVYLNEDMPIRYKYKEVV